MGVDTGDRTAPVKVGRRGFLKGAALGGVAAAASPAAAAAQADDAKAKPNPDPGVPRAPTPHPPSEESFPRAENLTYSSCGGDYMVDVMRSLGIEYFAATPGNTFMGVHEAVINYGMLTAPNLRSICTMHEEASVAMAHGYAKIEGKPMACMMHTTVGLQHGAMAIYNAYADRVPIFMMTGASIDASRRPGWVDWLHAANDTPALVRDFTKWDDTPGSLRHFGESAVRAWKFSMTPPYGPTLLAVDTFMQEDEIPGGATKAPPIPKMPKISPPSGADGDVREVARLLVNAEHPVIHADRMARTPDGLRLLVELAETLQAPVCDSTNRMNFPWRHPLNQSRRQRVLTNQADVFLALEPSNPFDLVTFQDKTGEVRPIMKPGAKAISISSVDLVPKGNYQSVQRYTGNIDLAMQADAQTTLPALIEEVKRQMPAGRKAALEARGQALAKAHLDELNRSKQAAVYGWDDRPISMPRLCQELYNEIADEDWSLVSDTVFQSRWPQQLWHADKHHRYIGGSGAAGIGYMSPAGLGAALANQKHGRLSVSIVGDGDLMFGPGILWTAAHERIPILYIVHNNRAYHMEIMQMQVIANRRQRGVDRLGIACGISDPNIDYATVAKGLGIFSVGPIENPKDLGPALKRAIAVVKKGEPALIDVVSQGR
ncbi:MAG: thiamine pyrophosphate binding protein [Caulobacteraceae bacterium]|nr:thiamine pyrophosphate binding protein [Caulobacteraceae bacterium]